MHITTKDEVNDILHTPHGEIIYELVGRGERSGQVQQHSMAYVTIPPGKSSPKHFHQQSEETYYILKGKGLITINGKEIPLSPGQACLIEAGEIHQIWNQGQDDLDFIAVCAPAWRPEDSFLAE